MERNCTINIIEDVDIDVLSHYTYDIIRSAFLAEGLVVREEFIKAIIYDDLGSIEYKGTTGKPISVQEIELVNNFYCAVTLLITLLQAKTFDVTFASISAFASQIMRKESVKGLHIPTVYATNLKGFGDTIQSNFSKIVGGYQKPVNVPSDELEEAELAERLKVCRDLIVFLNSSQYFVSANNALAYLMTVGYLYMNKGCIYLIDGESTITITEDFTKGDIFHEWL